MIREADPFGEVGVVIVTHQSEATIGNCLRALPEGLGAVAVVDCGSTDGTRAVVSSMGPLLYPTSNIGFGAASNIGLTLMPLGIRTVVFVNPDARADGTCIGLLRDALASMPLVVIAGPRLWSDGGEVTSAGRLPTLSTELVSLLPARLRPQRLRRETPPGTAVTIATGYVEGACFACDRSWLESTGGFDPRFFLFYEEADLGRRAATDGLRVVRLGEAVAWHRGRASRDQDIVNSQPHLYVSMIRYLRKHHGRASAAIAALAILASFGGRRCRGRVDKRLFRAILRPVTLELLRLARA